MSSILGVPPASDAPRGARFLVYDATDKANERALRAAWATGARVYRALGRIDAYFGASSWSSALHWLATHRAREPIASVQFWGHGKWGAALIADDVFSEASLTERAPFARDLGALRERFLSDGRSLIWFRTCETVGARRGQDFAMRLSDRLGARVAGHTYVIAAFQSGLHGLRPGERPTWSESEGLAEGTPDAPVKALWSSATAPNTVHFMNNEIPENCWARD